MKHRNVVLLCLTSVSLFACSVHGSLGAGVGPPPPPMIAEPGPAPGAPVQQAQPGGEAEVTCYDEDLKIVGKRIEGPGIGVLLAGSCDIVLEDCVIDAGTWGIVLRGSGDIVLVNSYVRGREGAVSQMGSGDIAARNSRFVGLLEKSGSGDFADSGSNQWGAACGD